MTLRTVVNVTLMKYVLIGHSFFEPVLISSDAGSRSDSEGVSDIQVAGKTTIFERRKFDRNNDSDDCKDSLLRTPMKKNMLAMIMPKDCIVTFLYPPTSKTKEPHAGVPIGHADSLETTPRVL